MVAQDLTGKRVAEEKPGVRTISLQEVAAHDAPNDSWIVLHNRVYDITQFFTQHPGGQDVLMEYAGRDGTLAYQEAGHSQSGLAAIEQYLIGVLPESERLRIKSFN